MWRGLHLREHWERAVLLHLTGLCLAAEQITSWSECFWQNLLVSSLQERQSIIKYWLDNLRAKHGEALHNITFLGGQPISKWQPRQGAHWEFYTHRTSFLMCVHCICRFCKEGFQWFVLLCGHLQSRSWEPEVWSSRCFLSTSRGSSVSSWSPGSRLSVKSSL